MNEKYKDKYLILPDKNGNRADTKIAMEYSDDEIEQLVTQGYVVVGIDDFNKLIGNTDRQYGISADGTLYAIPPYVPSPAELRAKKTAQLDSQYQSDKQELMGYYMEFMLAGDSEGMSEIQAELEALTEKYDASLAALKGGEE